MAKLLAMPEDNPPKYVKDSVVRALRPEDEAVLLPCADLDTTSGKYENIVFRLDATERDVPHTIFSPAWGAGVSAIKVSGPWVDQILRDPAHRQACLQKLRKVVESQTASPDVVVGPHVDGDENDRDLKEWTAGFDGPACFVGLYSAEHSCAPAQCLRGRDRCHSTSFLVVKAGAGQAADQFHARFMAALKTGGSLSEVFAPTGPGSLSASLRRVTRAGSRNRSRLGARPVADRRRMHGVGGTALRPEEARHGGLDLVGLEEQLGQEQAAVAAKDECLLVHSGCTAQVLHVGALQG